MLAELPSSIHMHGSRNQGIVSYDLQITNRVMEDPLTISDHHRRIRYPLRSVLLEYQIWILVEYGRDVVLKEASEGTRMHIALVECQDLIMNAFDVIHLAP